MMRPKPSGRDLRSASEQQLHGVNAHGKVALRRGQLRNSGQSAILATRSRESCCRSSFARTLQVQCGGPRCPFRASDLHSHRQRLSGPDASQRGPACRALAAAASQRCRARRSPGGARPVTPPLGPRGSPARAAHHHAAGASSPCAAVTGSSPRARATCPAVTIAFTAPRGNHTFQARLNYCTNQATSTTLPVFLRASI